MEGKRVPTENLLLKKKKKKPHPTLLIKTLKTFRKKSKF